MSMSYDGTQLYNGPSNYSYLYGTERPSRFYPSIEGRRVYGEYFFFGEGARSGKTLAAVRMIVHNLKTNPIYELVISNTPLDFSSFGMQNKYRYLDDIDLLSEEPSEGRKRIIFIDEIVRWADNRCSISQKNRVVTNVLSDTAKERMDFICSAQKLGSVDIRLKENFNYFLYQQFDEITETCVIKCFKDINAYLDYKEYGYDNSVSGAMFWGPTYYKYFKTGYHVADFHLKFHPERFAPRFQEWFKQSTISPEDFSTRLLSLWNSTEGIGLGKSELGDLATYLELNHDFKRKTRRKKA